MGCSWQMFLCLLDERRPSSPGHEQRTRGSHHAWLTLGLARGQNHGDQFRLLGGSSHSSGSAPGISLGLGAWSQVAGAGSQVALGPSGGRLARGAEAGAERRVGAGAGGFRGRPPPKRAGAAPHAPGARPEPRARAQTGTRGGGGARCAPRGTSPAPGPGGARGIRAASPPAPAAPCAPDPPASLLLLLSAFFSCFFSCLFNRLRLHPPEPREDARPWSEERAAGR